MTPTVIIDEGPGGAARTAFLTRQALQAATETEPLRPWHLRALHNPWSAAAARVDAWGVLDCCRAMAALAPLASVLPADLILFDTLLLPDPFDADPQDAQFFPVEPRAGCTLLRSIGAMQLTLADGDQLALPASAIALLPAEQSFVVTADDPLPCCLAARFFPADRRYLRDPDHPAHRALIDRLPLVNYAAMPLWLIAGEDRAGNDFVTGFNPRPAYWSAPPGEFGS